MATPSQKAVAHTTQTKVMTCPTCQQETRFTFLGVQEWPKHIAEKAGLPEKVQLWRCGNCETTITETDS